MSKLAAAPPSVSSLTYTWDLADVGVEAALARMREDGLGALDLNVSYHPVTAFTPAPGRRLMMLDDGAVFFPARTARYERIKPRVWPEPEVVGVWPKVAEAIGGLKLNAWLVCAFQPWIAREHPDCARTLPTGQAIPNAVCPSSADVREFLAALAGDVVSQFPVSLVQLEGVTSLRFDAGWRVPRILVELTPTQRRLLDVCFCAGCTGRGREAGIDVARLQARIQDALARGYEENGLAGESIASEPELAAYESLRTDASAELIEAVAAAIESESPSTELGIWGPADFDGTRTDLERVLPRVSALQLRSPARDPELAREARSLADANPGLRLRALQWCGGYVGPPFGSELEAAVRLALELPVDELNVFGWLMLSPSISRQIVPLVRRIEAELGVGAR